MLRSCIDAALALTGNTVGAVRVGDRQLPLPRLGPQAPLRATTGHVDAMANYAGQGVGAVTGIRPAAEVVRELADGAAQLLADARTEEGPGRRTDQGLREG